MMPTPEAFQDLARKLGFAAIGVCDAAPFARGKEALNAWCAAGYHGTMHYMTEPQARHDPRTVLPEVQSIVAVALPYAREDPSHHPIARYAQGPDYHQVLRDRLDAVAEWLKAWLDDHTTTRPCVDTAPLLEREAAVRAGLGFIGKSGMLIIPGLGTNVLLGCLLTDARLPTFSSVAADKCGTCTRCLSFCPTGAFVRPYVLDSRRCISYLTIEHRGVIPPALRPLIGERVFGCDVCQDVCPFNSSPKEQPDELPAVETLKGVRAIDLLTLGSAAYRKLVKGTALRRVSRHQLARNAAVAVGNSGNVAYVMPLRQALAQHDRALVRGHILWSLGQLGSPDARDAIEKYIPRDDYEREERAFALGLTIGPSPSTATDATITGGTASTKQTAPENRN